jgi:alpha-tubulin suppressor-like RCC1 family protein
MKITNTFIVTVLAIALIFSPFSYVVADNTELTDPSQLWSFGNNANGQTGRGTATGNTLVPTQAGQDYDWVEVSAGGFHSLSLKEDGTLWSFGVNSFGATGRGTTAGNTLVPTQVGSSSDWAAISAGTSFSLSLKEDGTLWSFGSNSFGRTGQGTAAGNTLTPTQVGAASDWTAISAGNLHALSLKEDGTLWSFGINSGGRTGLGTVDGDTLTPTQVGVASDWIAISAGNSHSLALKEDGTLWSFGSNSNGATGQGTVDGNTLTPTQVGVASDWAAISAGTNYSLSIKEDGTLWSFGINSSGVTGQGTVDGNTLTPTQVGVASDWIAISAGNNQSLSIKEDGTLWSFGNNTNGQTGLGTTVGNTLTPTQVGVASDWAAPAAGNTFSLALRNFIVIAPTIVTATATALTLESAQLNGELLTTGNLPIQGWGFNYGNTVLYGETIAGTTTLQNPGVFSRILNDLECGTTYHFQAYVTTAEGQVFGDDETLDTVECVILPTIITTEAEDITDNSAQLSGELLTVGNVTITEWGFNYGVTSAYGEQIISDTSLPTPRVFELALEDLECETLYHFQAFVTTTEGDVLGDDDTFTTAACASSSSGGSSSGGSTSIVRQYEIYMERGEYERAEALKQRWPRFFPEGAATSTSSTASSTETLIELVKKNMAVFDQAKALGIVLPEFVETLLQQAREALLIRDLELHMEGDDVLALQRLLNQNGYAVAAGSENGAPGFETTYFGERTEAALARYQTAAGITPAAGYFGQITRNHMKNIGLVGVWW